MVPTHKKYSHTHHDSAATSKKYSHTLRKYNPHHDSAATHTMHDHQRKRYRYTHTCKLMIVLPFEKNNTNLHAILTHISTQTTAHTTHGPQQRKHSCTQTQTHTHRYTHAHTQLHTHTNTHTCTHAHTLAYTHTRTTIPHLQVFLVLWEV